MGYFKFKNAAQICILMALFLAENYVKADPTRIEIYSRYDSVLRTSVYKDDLDSKTFWFIPPVKLYQQNGKIVYYKRDKGNLVDLYLYLVPTISNEQLRIMSQAIPGFVNSSQLKPVRLKQIGVSVQNFGTTEFSEEVTDLQYLNSPQTVKLSLSKLEAEDFEFLMNQMPGVQAKVLYNFVAQKVDKYIKIKLSAKQVYDALNIQASGQYIFVKGEIEAAISKYIVNQNLIIERKGDLPIPEIVQKIIAECFTPIKPKITKSNLYTAMISGDTNMQEAMLNASELENSSIDFSNSKVLTKMINIENFTENSNVEASQIPGASSGELNFQFKKELQNNTRIFYFSDFHYVDSTETVSVPVFLTTQMSGVELSPKTILLPQRNYTVSYFNEAQTPLRTGITVKAGEQYVIQGMFLFAAQSYYSDYAKQYYKRSIAAPSVMHELFYRVGDSPWQTVDGDGIYDGRAVIRDNGLFTGELQFALDREVIWQKISTEYTKSKVLGIIPAIFTYNDSYPEFSVSISGKKFVK